GLKAAPVTDRGWTPLHAASALLLRRVAAWLLDHGADPNRSGNNGMSPLDVAGRFGGHEREQDITSMAQLLRARGAVLSPRSAVILEDEEFLQKQPDLVAPRDSDGWLLALAVDYNRLEILRLLLDLGLDPDARVRVEGEDTVTFTWG